MELNPSEAARENLHKAEVVLLWLLRDGKIFMKQKTGIKCLKEGNSNKKLFHTSLLEKQAWLTIQRIKGSDGTWLQTEVDIQAGGITFFQQLLQADDISQPAME
ncbi:hypothetical protein ACH5RR_033795 [Cinchona calisaya]|uniref:Uncharacterized protein n=1 Tax=Cinchona calisaya TaxID=153742 RepID=A0ABD2Y903_9GENT